MSAVTVNENQKLYVIKTFGGYTTMGFENVYLQAVEMKTRLNKAGVFAPDVSETDKGTLEQYQQWQKLLEAYSKLGDTNTWFDPGTPQAVQDVLEAARREGTRVRLFLGNPETGEDWLDVWDTIGTVGRSMGPMRSPLLIEKSNSRGGHAILTKCVLRVLDTTTRRELYRNPAYHLPELKVDVNDGTHPFGVYLRKKDAWELHSAYKTEKAALELIEFLKGNRNSLPRN